MANKLVTIRHFSYGSDPVSEAELAKIKLEVRESNAEKALKILGTDTHIDFDETKDRNMKPEPINPHCPKCGSNSVVYEGFPTKMFYTGILFFRFPLPFLKKKYKCMNCGEIWK